MWFCPTVVVDGFFQNPESVVTLSETLKWVPAAASNWPGLRTYPLDQSCPELYKAIVAPIARTVIRDQLDPEDFRVTFNFQKISSEWENGWIHQDGSDMTSIIYLSHEQEGVNRGTSLYKIKDNSFPQQFFDKKTEAFENRDMKMSAKYRELHNSYYEPTTTIYDKFNRLVVFDPKQYHAANSFAGDHERLTIVGFWEFRNGRSILDQCRAFEY